MEKYLGNKAALLPLIEAFITSRVPEASSISDLFAGTTNVSRYFVGRGYDVALGDLNRFSYVLGQAYVGQAEAPRFERLAEVAGVATAVDRLHVEFLRAFRKSGDIYLPGLTAGQAWAPLRRLACVLAHLQAEGDRNQKPWIITDYFTKWGRASDYVSLRGTRGKRNYFARHNALVLDGILRTIRIWWQGDRLTPAELFILMTAVLEEVVITANVSGTFHDFNRDRLWPNAVQPFFLRVPLIRINRQSVEITNDDAVRAAGYVSGHDVCYIDPPYNFRQYTAYYHFLNFLAAVPLLDDLKGYLSGLRQVRGQNPDDDQSSDFCSKRSFVASLKDLIARVPARNVVLSYYNGRNHWNHWAAVDKPTHEGLEKLTALFNDTALFDTFEIVPALNIRKNYQSRIGERKALVDEYLFLGRRSKVASVASGPFVPLDTNVRWGLGKAFEHTVTSAQKLVEVGRLSGVG